MTTARALVSALFLVSLAGCAATIADLNGHPAPHYQSDVSITGQVSRVQVVGDQALLEVADARDKRVLVRTKAPVDVKPTDWVKVTGLFVPEAKIGEQTIYDTVLADEITPTKPPMLRDLF